MVFSDDSQKSHTDSLQSDFFGPLMSRWGSTFYDQKVDFFGLADRRIYWYISNPVILFEQCNDDQRRMARAEGEESRAGPYGMGYPRRKKTAARRLPPQTAVRTFGGWPARWA
jgi:hypothetical protein